MDGALCLEGQQGQSSGSGQAGVWTGPVCLKPAQASPAPPARGQHGPEGTAVGGQAQRAHHSHRSREEGGEEMEMPVETLPGGRNFGTNAPWQGRVLDERMERLLQYPGPFLTQGLL